MNPAAYTDPAWAAREARRLALEEAAAVVDDPREQPCECAYQGTVDGKGPYWFYDCHCSNSVDTADISSWCEARNNANRIRALAKEP